MFQKLCNLKFPVWNTTVIDGNSKTSLTDFIKQNNNKKNNHIEAEVLAGK